MTIRHEPHHVADVFLAGLFGPELVNQALGAAPDAAFTPELLAELTRRLNSITGTQESLEAFVEWAKCLTRPQLSVIVTVISGLGKKSPRLNYSVN